METKIVYVPAVGKVYTPEELADIFGRLGVGDALAQALRQILLQRFTAAAGDAAMDRLSEREAGHAGGRIAEVLALQQELMGYMGLAAERPTDAPTPAARGGPRRR